MVVKKIFSILSILLISVFMINCGSSTKTTSNNNTEAGTNGSGGDSSPGNSVSNGGQATPLQGTWSITCGEDPDFPVSLSETFDGSSYVQIMGLPTGPGCNNLATMEIGASFSVGVQSQSQGITTYEVDFGNNGYAIVRQNAGFFNTINFCGKSDWAVGQRVENILDQCPDWLIYNLVGIQGDQLYLGDYDSGDGSTPADRPTRLDTTFSLMRE